MLCFIPLYLRHGELALEIVDDRLKVGRGTTVSVRLIYGLVRVSPVRSYRLIGRARGSCSTGDRKATTAVSGAELPTSRCAGFGRY
jgi:hypothetical protein